MTDSAAQVKKLRDFHLHWHAVGDRFLVVDAVRNALGANPEIFFSTGYFVLSGDTKMLHWVAKEGLEPGDLLAVEVLAGTVGAPKQLQGQGGDVERKDTARREDAWFTLRDVRELAVHLHERFNLELRMLPLTEKKEE